MWPTLLNITRDDCRRTLRRLELEAYSNMIDVFRAQGALEDSRKKILEELRAVLHISNDRHSAEARRVANDELLATIADQLAGPNTGLAWISEGRRRVPLMPRGVAHTIYTEIADKAAEIAAAENKELLAKLEAESLAATETDKEEMMETDVETAESALNTTDTLDEMLYPPIATCDQSAKIWETELICRKRKIPETGVTADDASPPVKNIRNLASNANQKHPNVSQIYSKFSQPATSKPLSQSKHSYNQVSKVSTSKSNQAHVTSRPPTKHRAPRQNKNAAKIVISKTQTKRQKQEPGTPTKYAAGAVEYAAPPGSFQASYAQSLLGHKSDDVMCTMLTSPGAASEAPSLPAARAPPPSHPVPPAAAASLPQPPPQSQPQPLKHSISGKPCQLIIKKRGDITTTDKKVQMSDIKILQKPSEGLKLMTNRPVMMAPHAAHPAHPAHRPAAAGAKILTTKVLGPVGKTQPHVPAPAAAPSPSPAAAADKMIVVSKQSADQSLDSSKIIISMSGAASTGATASLASPRGGSGGGGGGAAETITGKGIPTTDIKVSAAKTFLLNPKSGQKMVVVPAKARTKQGTEGQNLPLLHFKGMPTTMRLVPVGSPAASAPAPAPAPAAAPPAPSVAVAGGGRPAPVSVACKSPAGSAPPAAAAAGRVAEPVKTANMADIVLVKGLAPVAKPVVRPAGAKGNVILVQKNATIGKAMTFAKNGNDMSKIIMGKNVNRLLQGKEQVDGKVIVLELNNDRAARATTMSEILDSRSAPAPAAPVPAPAAPVAPAAADTPVLFDTQVATGPDSAAESIGDLEPMDAGSPLDKADEKAGFGKEAKSASRVTDWEMELEVTKGKDDDDKLNSLHLDLGMSSDSDSDFIGDARKAKSKHVTQVSIAGTTPSGVSREAYSGASGLSHATRTLLSQLQDEGSSSNDSSFALKSKTKLQGGDAKTDINLDKSESEALNKAKEKLTEKVAKSQLKRIDIYSTAISTSDINLDAFSYLEEDMMAEEEPRRPPHLDVDLGRLLADSADSADSDSQTISESSPSNK